MTGCDLMGVTMRHFARFWGAALVVMVACRAEADPLGDPAEGHRLALKICSACHVVAADQDIAPIVRNPAPSFQAIANRPGTSAASMQHFVQTIHRTLANGTNMPNPRLTDEQATDIASYIVSLRTASPDGKK
jgi:mono/diheme cytochrome c family protein